MKGNRAFIGTAAGFLHSLDLQSFSSFSNPISKDEISSLCAKDDTIVAASDQLVKIWDPVTNSIVKVFSTGEAVSTMDITFEGNLLVGTKSGAVMQFDFRKPDHPIYKVAFDLGPICSIHATHIPIDVDKKPPKSITVTNSLGMLASHLSPSPNLLATSAPKIGISTANAVNESTYLSPIVPKSSGIQPSLFVSTATSTLNFRDLNVSTMLSPIQEDALESAQLTNSSELIRKEETASVEKIEISNFVRGSKGGDSANLVDKTLLKDSNAKLVESFRLTEQKNAILPSKMLDRKLDIAFKESVKDLKNNPVLDNARNFVLDNEAIIPLDSKESVLQTQDDNLSADAKIAPNASFFQSNLRANTLPVLTTANTQDVPLFGLPEIRTIIREELNTFHEESTMRQLKNLHLDILSQFQLQQREMERMIGEYTSQMNQLVEENRQLRTALEKKNVFF